jgi:hypothetical protein
MVTEAGEGKSTGAVYSPAEEIVPRVEFPPSTLLTAHWTVLSAVFVTVAKNACEFPRSTKLVIGVTVTTIAGAGDGGGGVAEPPLPQPCRHTVAPNASSGNEFEALMRGVNFGFGSAFEFLRERNRMTSGMQAKGQRRS